MKTSFAVGKKRGLLEGRWDKVRSGGKKRKGRALVSGGRPLQVEGKRVWAAARKRIYGVGEKGASRNGGADPRLTALDPEDASSSSHPRNRQHSTSEGRAGFWLRDCCGLPGR